MAKRDDIVIGFGGDDSRFRRVARRVSSTVSDLTSSVQSLGNTIASAFGIGIGAGGAGLVAGVAKLTQELDELGKTAKGLNTTTEALSALQFAVSQTSTLTDQQFATALQRLVKHIGQANRGIKESQAIFEELGLSWEYLASLQSDQAFLEVADAIRRIDNAYAQASVNQKLFEDNWRAISTVVGTSREELEGFIQQAHDLGVPTDEAALAAARLNDQIGIMNRQLQGLAYQWGPDIIGFFSTWAEHLTGVSGQQGLPKVLSEIGNLERAIDQLEGRGDWFSRIWSKFLTEGEAAEQVAELRKELERLYKEAERLQREAAAREAGGTGGTGGAGGTGGTGGNGGRNGDRGKPGPELTYHEQNLADWADYRSGKISREEWLQRERDRNPYVNPDSPYADDFGTQPNYTSLGSPGGYQTGSYIPPEVSIEFKSAIAQAVAAAMEGRVYKMKVLPQMVGEASTLEMSSQQEVIREGSNPL